MNKVALGNTGFDIVPLIFGGNVFGWTLDQKASFSILDAFIDHGFDAIDTADMYSTWVEGNKGGESETIIGNWLAARPGMRDKIKLFTKVGSEMGSPEKSGLSEKWIMQAIDDSLTRLKTDYVDLYFTHRPDANTTDEETLGAYEKLLKAGKIRSIGTSNYNAEQLAHSLDVAKAQSLPAYQVLQPEYNLYDRDGYDKALQKVCREGNVAVVTYYSLASGFLTGKYRSQHDLQQSARGAGIAKYLDAKGMNILKALDEVSQAHSAQPAEVALAWLLAQDCVTAPIASATKPAHIETFTKAIELNLTQQEVSKLTQAGDC